MKRSVEVAGAILLYQDKILGTKKGAAKYAYTSFKYEFPGGKLEPGESPAEALHRELLEEMDLDIPVQRMKPYLCIDHTYPDFSIRLHTFLCPMDSPELNLKEHIEQRLFAPQELADWEWAPADAEVLQRLRTEDWKQEGGSQGDGQRG